jgi:hypothetical protein
MGLLSEFLAQLKSVQTVWMPFVLAAAIVAIAAWKIAKSQTASAISSLEHRIRLRDDEIAEYKRQFSGASPDDARAMVDALEKQVAALPRRRKLDSRQKEAIKAALAGAAGLPTLRINYPEFSEDAALYASSIATAITEAGWEAKAQTLFIFPRVDNRGICVARRDDTTDREARLALEAALKAAGIEFHEAILPQDFALSLYLFVDAAEED